MRFLSVCSGIESASVAWPTWTAVGFAEVDPFACAVLEYRYPETPNFGDLTRHQEWPDVSSVDVLVGGTPCQSFSVAGLRAGLDDPRGQLVYAYLGLARRLRPRWLVWENVPGVLSIDDGRAMGSFLGGLGQLGYGWAYRVLDAQYFGVPQRRRRVFVVGHLGDWRRAAAVLFESASLSGHPPPRRDAGQSIAPGVSCGPPFSRTGNERIELEALVAPTLPTRRTAGGGLGTDFDCDGGLIPDVVGTLDANYGHLQGASGHDACHGHSHLIPTGDVVGSLVARMSRNGAGANEEVEQNRLVAFGPGGANISHALSQRDHKGTCSNLAQATLVYPPAVAFQSSQSGIREVDAHATLDSHNGSRRHNGVITGATVTPDPTRNRTSQTYIPGAVQVRRLTPRECERLQGFPDDYTLIPYHGRPAKDGPRYKALGNAMAVPVMAWLGQRLERVDALPEAPTAAVTASAVPEPDAPETSVQTVLDFPAV